MQIIINSGHLSVDNGAKFPLNLYFELAALLKTPALTGASYYDDRLELSESDWPSVEALLKEANMLYKVEGVHDTWQNVQTDEVRRRLSPVAIN